MAAVTVEGIPAFNDNYIWLVSPVGSKPGSPCAVVDPGDAGPVEQLLTERQLKLTAILVTHHHPDHIGGVPRLVERYRAKVFGPVDERIRGLDQVVGQGDRVDLADLDLVFDVIEVPGHTRSHIAYFGDGMLFCGDTLFSVGCGRLFEGTPEQMQDSLDRIAALPGGTRVYCAHEYTESNCAFALAVEPENGILQERALEVEALRQEGRRTVPSLLAEEKAVNPFLRTRQDAVVAAAQSRQPGATPGASTLGVIRAWKDSF
jgi:hydroxyacylglutathione hydrolase